MDATSADGAGRAGTEGEAGVAVTVRAGVGCESAAAACPLALS